MTMDDNTGLDLAIGTIDEAFEWIGKSSDMYRSPMAVNRPMIQFYCSLIRDNNPSFWDESFALNQWGGIYSPLGMLRAWRLNPLWHPVRENNIGSGPFAADIPLPAEYDTIINVKTSVSSHRPLIEGERLHWKSRLTDLSEKKNTHLGEGFFLTTKTHFENDDGIQIAELTNDMLRYRPENESNNSSSGEIMENRYQRDETANEITPETYESISIDEIDEGESLPSISYPISYRRIIHNAAATRDFYPGHHDPEFARNQGVESIYFSTMGFQGLIDRFALEWTGPKWRVRERSLSISGSATPGDILTVKGDVNKIDMSNRQAKIDVSIHSQKLDAEICPAKVTVTQNE